MRSGVAWSLTSRALQFVTLLVANATLARLLAPRDFGVVSMSAIFLNVANGLADFGVRSYIVQKKELTERDLRSAQMLSWLVGGAVTLAGIGAAYPLARFYHEPRLIPVLGVQSLTYLALNVASVRMAVLSRAMDFRRLSAGEIAGTLAYAVSACGLAWAGASYWALILARIAQSTVSLLVITTRAWQWVPRGTRLRDVKRVAAFGGTVTITGVLGQLDENFDNIAVGRSMGSAALGLYAVSYSAAALPQKYLAFMVASVAYPVLSQASQGEFPGLCRRFVRYQVLGPASMAVVISVLAPEVCRMLFGSKWPGAPPLVGIMALSTAGLSVATTVGGILLSRGLARSVLIFQSIKFTITMTGVLGGVAWGLRGVAAGFLAAVVASLVAGLIYAAHQTGQGALVLLRAAVNPALGVALAGGACWSARAAMISTQLKGPVIVALGSGAVYLLVLAAWVASRLPEEWRELLQAMPTRFHFKRSR